MTPPEALSENIGPITKRVRDGSDCLSCAVILTLTIHLRYGRNKRFCDISRVVAAPAATKRPRCREVLRVWG